MATVVGTGGPNVYGTFKFTWEALKNTDDGNEVICAQFPIKSVQVLGTFSGPATVIMEGSNDGGTTWAPLTDKQGSAISFTSAGIAAIEENMERIRPLLTAGDASADIDVIVVGRA